MKLPNLSRYQVKLFALCLLVGAVPVLALGIFSYIKSSGLIEDKVLRGNDQLLLQTETQLENTLKIVDISIFQLANSQEVSDILRKPVQAKDFPLVDKLLEMMQRIQIYELGIRDIRLIDLDENWTISNRGYAKPNEQAMRERLSPFLSGNHPLKWMTAEPESGGGDGQAAPGVYLIKRFPSYSANPHALLVTEMSSEELFKVLPADSGLGAMAILDGEGRIVAASPNFAFGASLPQSPVLRDIGNAGDANGYMTGTLGGEKVGFTYRKSAYNGWTYLLIVSLGSITRDSQAIGWATAWACAVIIALIILLSLRGASRLYSPLRALYQKTADSVEPFEPEETRDEFKAIERRIERMSQSNLRMSSSVLKLRQQLQPFMMFKLLQGEWTAREIGEQLQLFGYSQPIRRLAVVTIRIDSLQHTRYVESDRDLLLFAIGNIVEETVAPEHRMSPVVIDQSQVTILRGSQESAEAFKTFIHETILLVQRHIRDYLGLTVCAGISRSYESYDGLPGAYAEGLDALKYRIAKEEQTIFFIEAEEPGTQMVYFPEHLEKQLVEAVAFSDERRAAALLGDFLHILSNRELTHHQMQNWLLKLLLDLLYVTEQPDTALSPLDTNAIPLSVQLKRLNTVQEIERWFVREIIEPAIRKGEAGGGAPFAKIAGEVIRMIQTEYDRELTLEECASRLNYHPSYIRRALKKSMNTNFTDYLLAYRMEIAKKWLVETEMKIADMSRRLQYNNAQNFIRCFKKVAGMTPGQYRLVHGHDEFEYMEQGRNPR